MEERETLAEWMMHNVQTQLGTYTKATGTKRKKTSLKGAGKRPRVILLLSLPIYFSYLFI